MAKRKRVGIDLGTTYSSLAYLDANDKPTPIPDFEGELATPSIVYFPAGGKPPLAGRIARDRSLEDPGRSVANAKRHLGSSHAWEIDGVVYTPVDISSFIVRKLLRDAEREIGEIREAVVTVPAHFSGHQRRMTIEAGMQAGLEKVSIVNEPVAAALAFVMADYVLEDDTTFLLEYMDESQSILVYDLGGGTFDLSVVRFDKTQLRVVAALGDQQLGGIDWDQEIVDLVAERLLPIRGEVRNDQRAVRKLADRVERAKRALSNADKTTFLIAHDGWEEEFIIERAEFEDRTRPLVNRTRLLVQQLLDQCKLTWDELDAMVPVGGSTWMPMIKKVLESFREEHDQLSHLAGKGPQTGKFIRKISPELSVAAGAALFAGIICAGDDSEAKGMSRLARLLTSYRTQNVSAQPLGILLRDRQGKKMNHVLIPRNATLPVTEKVSVSTTKDNQPRASVKIVEGDLNDSDNVICKCTIDLPPARRRTRSLT